MAFRRTMIHSHLVWSVGLLALTLLAASDAPTPEERYRQAQDLEAIGAYARARNVLRELQKQKETLSPQQLKNVEEMLRRVEETLIREARMQEEAAEEQRAQAEKALQEKQAHERRLAALEQEAEVLMKRDTADSLMEARAIYLKVARMRAKWAYDRAVELHERGEYDKAAEVFAKLAQNEQYLDIPIRQRVRAYLERVPFDRENQEVGRVLLAEARKRQEEEARERQEFLAKRKEATTLLARAQTEMKAREYESAKATLEQVKSLSRYLRREEQSEVDSLLATATTEVEKLVARRMEAEAHFKKAAELMAEKKYAEAKLFLRKLAETEIPLPPDKESQRLAFLAEIRAWQQEEDKKRLAAAEAEFQVAKDEVTRLDRAAEFMAALRRQEEIRRQEEHALAEHHYKIAVELFKQLKYNEALEQVNTALEHERTHAGAQNLRAEILAILRPAEVAPATVKERWRTESQVRFEQARIEMGNLIQSGVAAFQKGDFDKALNDLENALATLNFLRPQMDVTPYEGHLKSLIESAKARKREKEAELARRRDEEAARQAALEAERARALSEQQLQHMLNVAVDLFAKGQNDAAIAQARKVLEKDPGNLAAREIIAQATKAERERAWMALEDERRDARQRGILLLRSKNMYQPEHVTYPAKELWAKIVDRGPVELPSGYASRTPRELELREALQKPVDFSFEDTPLRDVVEFLRTLVQKNIVLDPKVVEESERLVTMSLKNVTLQSALNLILGQDLGWIIKDEAIYISTKQNLRRIEPLDFRIYDVRDLLVVYESATGGTTSTSTTSTSTSTGTRTTTDTTGTTASEQGGGELLSLIITLTGPENWRSVQLLTGERTTDTSTTGGFGGGGFGGGGFGGGGFGGLGGGTGGLLGGEGAAAQGEGAGLMVLRQGDLLVKQSDRIHQEIEQILTALREQTLVQVNIAAKYITFTDDFIQEFGMDLTNLSFTTKPHHVHPKLFHIPRARWQVSFSTTTPFATAAGGFAASAQLLDHPNAQLVIHAAKESEHAQILQEPSVTTLNAQEAELDVVSTIEYVSSYTVGEGGTPVPTKSTISPGSTLTVRPYVSADRRYVTLYMEPSISTVTFTEDFIEVTTPGTPPVTHRLPVQSPTENSQTVRAPVIVPDRGTLVVGGLATVTDTEYERGIPILAHIPFIKRLFSHKSILRLREHLIIMVTPTILLRDELEASIPS